MEYVHATKSWIELKFKELPGGDLATKEWLKAKFSSSD